LSKDFLELVEQVFVLALEGGDGVVLLVDVLLVLPDLMFIGVDLVLVDVPQFFDFAFAGSFRRVDLALDEGVVLVLFGLPPA
jgi:hypothetical protein